MSNYFKTTLIGASTTGKSSIVKRMITGTFNISAECTIGVSFNKLKHNDIEFQLWDTAGQERFRSLLPMYFRGTSIFIFVFDVNNMPSINDFDRYLEHLYIIDNCKIIIVGNKIDLIPKDDINNIDIELRKKFNSMIIKDKIHDYVFTSAKTGDGIDDLILAMDACGKAMKQYALVKPKTINLKEEPVSTYRCVC